MDTVLPYIVVAILVPIVGFLVFGFANDDGLA